MKLEEAFALDNEDFSKLSPSRKKIVTGAIEYIGDMSRVNGVDVREWDLYKVFGKGGKTTNPNPLNIKTKREDLTKAFFDYKRELIDEPDKGIPQDLLERIEKNSIVMYNSRISSLESELSSQKEQADRYFNSGQNKLDQAYDCWTEIQAIKGNGNTLPAQVKNIINSGKFDYHTDFFDHDKKLIEFTNVNDVILKHTSSALGKYRLNMGKYRIVVDLNSLRVTVRPHIGNIHCNSANHIHPHVRDGSICWGNGANAVSRAVGQGNLLGILEILHELLNTYNSKGPYVALDSYHEHANSYARKDYIPAKYITRYNCNHCGHRHEEKDYDIAKIKGGCVGCGGSLQRIHPSNSMIKTQSFIDSKFQPEMDAKKKEEESTPKGESNE